MVVKELEAGKSIVVVYRELSSEDGFVDHVFHHEQALGTAKEEENVAMLDVAEIVELAPRLLGISSPRMWASYDAAADVLYVNFKRPSHADESELTADDVIVRYEKGDVVGVTILHASKRARPGGDGP